MNIKHYINGVSLNKYCIDNGISESKYKLLIWRIKNKCMTPEQALEYKRPPAREDQRQRKLEGSRRFRGYGDSELNLTTEEAKERGRMLRTKYLFKGKTIGELSKEYNIARGALYHRIITLGMYWKDAVSYPPQSETSLKYKGQSIYKLFDKKKADRIRDRVNHGWKIEEAINTPIKSNWRYMSNLQRFGKDYKEITRWE